MCRHPFLALAASRRTSTYSSPSTRSSDGRHPGGELLDEREARRARLPARADAAEVQAREAPGGTEPASLPDDVADRRGHGASEHAEDSFPLTAREEPADHRLDLPPRAVRQVDFGDRRRRRWARRKAVHL